MAKKQIRGLWPLTVPDSFGLRAGLRSRSQTYGVQTLGVFACATAVTLAILSPAAQAQSASLSNVRDPEQVPTARYGRGEAVDLALIIDEWRDRYPSIPVFACTCNADTCGDQAIWPFREYALYEPFVALGDVNATNNQSTGFNCFDMETGNRPKS